MSLPAACSCMLQIVNATSEKQYSYFMNTKAKKWKDRDLNLSACVI